MSELTLTLIKIGFLALLWLFVLSSVSVIRSDLFGERVDQTAPSKPSKRPAKQPKRRRGAPTQLVISEGVNAGVSVPLEGEPVLLGRGADATIRLDDDYVSTRHARVVAADAGPYVEDLGSTNGTYVNGQRITAPTSVSLVDTIRIGKTVLKLEV